MFRHHFRSSNSHSPAPPRGPQPEPPVTTASRSATASRNVDVRVICGNAPPVPPAPVQLTDQVVVTVTVKNRSFGSGPDCGSSADERLYVYVQSECCELAGSLFTYGVPGPAHVNGAEPSPGSHVVFVGRATTTAHAGPACVLCLNVAHNDRGTQNHSAKFTSARGVGFHPAVGAGKRS